MGNEGRGEKGGEADEWRQGVKWRQGGRNELARAGQSGRGVPAQGETNKRREGKTSESARTAEPCQVPERQLEDTGRQVKQDKGRQMNRLEPASAEKLRQVSGRQLCDGRKERQMKGDKARQVSRLELQSRAEYPGGSWKTRGDKRIGCCLIDGYWNWCC